MAYKKDQGRYARMVAFWGLFLLMAYGCLGSLVYSLEGWLELGPDSAWIKPFPLLGEFNPATAIGVGVLAVVGFVIYRLLNRPRAADLLIETETELRKVTWPSFADTWAGTLAVVVTVAFLLLYLTGADFLLGFALKRLMGVG